MGKTLIEWTGYSWNYVTGCDQVSPGCDHCYALTIAERFRGGKAFPNGFAVTLHPDRLNFPKTLKKPSMIFVNSMSDWCHKEIPLDLTLKAFRVMLECPQHTFQLLTKRAPDMRRLAPVITDLVEEITGTRAWPENIWLGVSVESYKQRGRIKFLRETPAKIKFISYEPALGPLLEYSDVDFNLGTDLTGIDWIIAGCESGHSARTMSIRWIQDVRDYCVEHHIALFFKQALDSKGHKISLPELDGRQWKQYPVVQS